MNTDKKTLLLSLEQSGLTGVLFPCGGLPSSRTFIETAYPYSALGYYTGDFLMALSLVLGALISPAILASVARQFYPLWSLMPPLLLMLWAAIGSIIVHHSPLDREYFAAFLAVLGTGWSIASLPISLSRFVRDKYRKKPDPISTPGKCSRRQFAAVSLPFFFIVLIYLGWYNFQHPPRFNGVMQPHWLSGNAAKVPLIKRGTGVYVEAWLND